MRMIKSKKHLSMTAKASATINHTKDLSLAKPIKKVNGRGS